MGSPADVGEGLDQRIEYARAVAAHTRIEIAIAALAAAASEVGVTIGAQHDTTKAIGEALQQARIADAKLQQTIRALGRIR